MVHCCDIATSYFVAKVWRKTYAHFHAATIKLSSMQNLLFGMQGQILCEQVL
jgi:hypothetical protein